MLSEPLALLWSGSSNRPLYTIRYAAGATPEMSSLMPSPTSTVTGLPAAVPAVCEPWPATSRGEKGGPSSTATAKVGVK